MFFFAFVVAIDDGEIRGAIADALIEAYLFPRYVKIGAESLYNGAEIQMYGLPR